MNRQTLFLLILSVVTCLLLPIINAADYACIGLYCRAITSDVASVLPVTYTSSNCNNNCIANACANNMDEDCANQEDDNGNGLVDCSDLGCINNPLCVPSGLNLFMPSDTSCSGGWPGHQGDEITLNSHVKSCDLFEVRDGSLNNIVKEAYDCCSNFCQGASCHYSCEEASTLAGATDQALTPNQLKKCMGLYTMYAIGSEATILKSYFAPELCCAYGTEVTGIGCNSFNCDSDLLPLSSFNDNAKHLTCKRYPEASREWLSDTDMSMNNCYLTDVPAHTSINVLKTGTCADYSSVLTTVLRKEGYRSDEVYTTVGPSHVFNLVKLPGDEKYTIIDTTGNSDNFGFNPGFIMDYGLREDSPGHYVPVTYCDCLKDPALPDCQDYTLCSNDNGVQECPSPNVVNRCEE